MRLIKITPEEYMSLLAAGAWVYSSRDPIVKDWHVGHTLRYRHGDVPNPFRSGPPSGWNLYTKA